jgi:hypothetical protein
MRRPYLIYILAVVFPSALTVAAGLSLAGWGWVSLRHASETRTARAALVALEQDIATTVVTLVQEAQPRPDVEVEEALLGRALAGDTADVLAGVGADAQIHVARPPEEGDPPGTVRWAAAPLPHSAIQAAGTAGYRGALYVGGRQSMATTPAPGPENLDRGIQAILGRTPAGVPLDEMDTQGVIVPLVGVEGSPPPVAVLISSPSPGAVPLPIPLLLVMALLLLFACLAGWIQLTGESPATGGGSFALLALVPALTAWGFLVHGERLFSEAVTESDGRDLSRAVAIARLRGVLSDPGAVYALSGFHGYRVAGGRVEAASLEGAAPAIAALPAPPGSFAAAGRVVSPEGRVAYVALRVPGGAFSVTTAPPSQDLLDAYRARARRLALFLAGWLTLVTGVLWAGRRRLSS